MPAYSTDKGFTGNKDQTGRSIAGGAHAAGKAAAANASGGNQYAGYKGPTGTRAPTSAAPGSYGLSGPETRAYNSAKTEYQNRGFGKRVVDFLSPIKSVNPQINQPASYQGGKYHHGFNPAGLVAGTLAPYGSGLLVGPAAGALYNNMGGHDVVLTGEGSGFSTSYPDGGPGYNSSTGYAGPVEPNNHMPGRPGPGGTIPGAIPGPIQPSMPSIMNPGQQAPAAQPPSIFAKKPIVQNSFQVGGGSPYGFNIFGRAA